MDETRITEHPTDTALAAWVDERAGDDVVAVHLAACAGCRERAAALEDVVTALRAEPAPPDPAALARNRAGIEERIGAGDRVRLLRPRSFWWVPTAAAAAIAVLFLARNGSERPPADPVPAVESAARLDPLPVVAAAEEAAAEAASLMEADLPADPGAEITDMELTVLESDPLPGAGIADFDLVEDFEGLAPDDQDAVLMELATTDFEL